MTIKNPKVQAGLDLAALIILLAAELTMNIVCFVVMAPDALTTVAFSAVAAVLILFGTRALMKGYKALWLVLTVVIVFFDTSFLLVETSSQSEATVTVATTATDSELQRLTAKADASAATLKGLHEEYAKAMRPETLKQLDAQLSDAKRTADTDEQRRTERLKLVESGGIAKANHKGVSADAIFGAMVQAVPSRIPQLIIFLCISVGMQWGIRAAISDRSKAEAASPAPGLTSGVPSTVAAGDSRNLPLRGAEGPALSSGSVPELTERLYIQRSWPVAQSYITAASVVSKANNWPLEDCQRLEEKIYGSAIKTRVDSKIIPKINREAWLKQRTAEGRRKHG